MCFSITVRRIPDSCGAGSIVLTKQRARFTASSFCYADVTLLNGAGARFEPAAGDAK